MTPTDPWTRVRTRSDLPADEVISALQKEIRRGNVENAAALALEMVDTSPELEGKLWDRLGIISVEDVGLGEPNAPAVVVAIQEIANRFAYGEGDRELAAVHAVRYLATCQKERGSEELLSWLRLAVADGSVRPQIPDYAVDMHTARGAAMGRGRRHFYSEGARVSPEMDGRETGYLERLLAALEEDDETG